jgi:hypothetical protein
LLSSPSALIFAAALINQNHADELPEQSAAQKSQSRSKRNDTGGTRLKESETEGEDDSRQQKQQ